MYYYYYNLLNHYEKEIYWQIEDAIRGLKTEIFIRTDNITLNRIAEISRMVTVDSPEFYWSKGNYDAINVEKNYAQLKFSFYRTKSEIINDDQTIIHKIADINIDYEDTVENNVVKVFNWMKNNIQYDYEMNSVQNPLNQTIYSAMIKGKSLCMGIAKAFNLIMRLSGIDSFVVLGNVFGEKRYGHSWNAVKVGNEYKYVDITMSYPLFQHLWKEYHGDKSSRCLLVPYEYIAKSHVIDKTYRYLELNI